MSRHKSYSVVFRARAVRLVLEQQDEYDSQLTAIKSVAGVNRKLKCPLVDKEIAVSIILCISPYLATVPVSLQAHVPTTLPCASPSTGNFHP